jgi:hypothetical protein
MLLGRRGRVKAGLEERGRGRRSGCRRGTWCAVVEMCWDGILRQFEDTKGRRKVLRMASVESRGKIPKRSVAMSLYLASK